MYVSLSTQCYDSLSLSLSLLFFFVVVLSLSLSRWCVARSPLLLSANGKP